jgi:hypothetical protein
MVFALRSLDAATTGLAAPGDAATPHRFRAFHTSSHGQRRAHSAETKG